MEAIEAFLPQLCAKLGGSLQHEQAGEGLSFNAYNRPHSAKMGQPTPDAYSLYLTPPSLHLCAEQKSAI
eukprot:1157504-Pelagomonas_calceolata.AAC.2